MMKILIEKYGPWAIITGASSGIGATFARELAALNFNLVLVARRKNRMEKIASDLRKQYHININIVELDLSKDDFMQEIISATAHLDIGLLINNAGFALTGAFLGHSLEDEIRLLDVNCKAPLVLSHYFGNKMVQKGGGGMINVSSASAFSPLPYWTHYSASKAYHLYFSEGLWYELKQNGVDVLALCPGATQTEFAKTAGTNMKGMDPDQVVKTALHKLGRRSSVIVGVQNRFFTAVMKIIPKRIALSLGAMVIKRSRITN